jgi:hypothetical protein
MKQREGGIEEKEKEEKTRGGIKRVKKQKMTRIVSAFSSSHRGRRTTFCRTEYVGRRASGRGVLPFGFCWASVVEKENSEGNAFSNGVNAEYPEGQRSHRGQRSRVWQVELRNHRGEKIDPVSAVGVFHSLFPQPELFQCPRGEPIPILMGLHYKVNVLEHVSKNCLFQWVQHGRGRLCHGRNRVVRC